MRILFAEPPEAQAVGGLEQAIATLHRYLHDHGVDVRRHATSGDLLRADLVHFHGLWQPAHAWMSFQCRRNDIPYVVSPHGMLEPWAWDHKAWKKRPYYTLVEHRHIDSAHRVLATSEQEKSNLECFVEAPAVQAVPLALSGAVGPGVPAGTREARVDDGRARPALPIACPS